MVSEANGKPLTPTLLGGVTENSIEEVSAEQSTVDSGLAMGAGGREAVWMNGRGMHMRLRQMELRERYHAPDSSNLPSAYLQ